jgi:hypothetical protein
METAREEVETSYEQLRDLVREDLASLCGAGGEPTPRTQVSFR